MKLEVKLLGQDHGVKRFDVHGNANSGRCGYGIPGIRGPERLRGAYLRRGCHLLDEQESEWETGSAFASELFRSRLHRALEEGEVTRLQSLPRGIGLLSCIVRRNWRRLRRYSPAERAGMNFSGAWCLNREKSCTMKKCRRCG